MSNSPVLVKGLASTEAGDSLCLNLGGRDQKIKGFLTVDLKEGSDIVSDISDLKDFKDHTVDEIYASHCLEHFSIQKTVYVLEEWHRVLKKGKPAYIAVPDFDAAVRLYQNVGFVDVINHLLWGDQEYALAYHYSGFNYPFLANLLMKAGFNDVQRIKEMPYGLADCSTLRDTHYGIPLSLNVKAIA